MQKAIALLRILTGECLFMKEKTSCYDDCSLRHDCVGGYVSENGICEEEIKRVLKILEERTGAAQFTFGESGIDFYILKKGKKLDYADWTRWRRVGRMGDGEIQLD